MVLMNDVNGLLAAWRSLSGLKTSEGWLTIPIIFNGSCRLLAGRRFPGNEEVLLVGFNAICVPSAHHLPQGLGFEVCKALLGQENGAYEWVALCRQSAGSLELFTMMANDIISSLTVNNLTGDERLLHGFLSRIRAWQEFMQRGKEKLLSPEAEIGLFGELKILEGIIAVGLPAIFVVESWEGPLGGMHDFKIGTGAIEVKSTISVSGFKARISSLDQLDNLLVQPLFLAAVRLALNNTGHTLPEIIAVLRDILCNDLEALNIFNSRLIYAGFLDDMSENYTRSFQHVETRILSVTDQFQKLTRGNVGMNIIAARYELELNLVNDGEVPLVDALQQLKII